ncbi:DUF1800 family protein [Thalassotalea sp. PS06]|uniref:DUF1800 domain-containing protein n=1 Tax=Thalassotalea sp. PS06 TaxID=2594005 RepID=UPI0011638063|nr:DUF1800 domain-containing protein [Thalassotalea sp. PS06]QDP02330.1 DUF1800 domain-containing protein [Thalassotalea sp. PS06]
MQPVDNANPSHGAAIAANRFGIGAKSGELEAASANPQGWVMNNLKPISFEASCSPNSSEILIELANIRQLRKKRQALLDAGKRQEDGEIPDDLMDPAGNYFQATYRQIATDSFNQALATDHGVSWRLLDFFSNHFSVSASSQGMTALAATLEREAIAPYLLGSFTDMLIAVCQHPAMLIYLNNEKSFGPNSIFVQHGRLGLNENLAREILELHTLGVDGGYTQADVIELAKGITGWSVKKPLDKDTTGFKYRSYGHEPGARTLLGKTYSQKGIEQGEAMLKDLAAHPNTAKFITRKLAVHFVSDEPSTELLQALEKRWMESSGNIAQVMDALIHHPESWQHKSVKFKSPRDFVYSSLRGLGVESVKQGQYFSTMRSLGQAPFKAGSPAGFGDVQQTWDGASALMARIEWSSEMARRAKDIDPVSLMATTLGSTISHDTYAHVSRAESRDVAMTLLLMSPEFQRR